MGPKYDKQQLLSVFESAGLNVPSLISTLSENMMLLQENVNLVQGIMDERTSLTERVKILELEVLINILRKISE